VKITFVCKSLKPFTRVDLGILSQKYTVSVVDFQRRFIHRTRLIVNIITSDVVYCWFAGRHALWAVLMAKLFRKKIIVVTGGYDVVRMSEINYGSMCRWPTRKMVQFIAQMADRIFSVSRSNMRDLLKNTRVDPGKVVMIPHGVPLPKNLIMPFKISTNLVITVGDITAGTLKRKGLENFVLSAQRLPQVHFMMIGKENDKSLKRLQSMAPPNVDFTGFLPESKLFHYMCKASVYVQASAHEAFGFAVAEAMLRGCIPVTTNRGGLAETVNGIGIIVEYGNPDALADGIRKALNMTQAARYSARSHIMNHFSLQNRTASILQNVEAVLDKHQKNYRQIHSGP
jgi:glycosyltransferase involved in cell wall biosynthesis